MKSSSIRLRRAAVLAVKGMALLPLYVCGVEGFLWVRMLAIGPVGFTSITPQSSLLSYPILAACAKRYLMPGHTGRLWDNCP